MLVEFIGPPGAGKTTLASLVAGDIRGRGALVNMVHVTGYENFAGANLSARQIRADQIRSLIGQPRLSLEAFKCLVLEGKGTASSWTINMARRSWGSHRCRKLSGVTLLAEGPLSALCLIGCARRTDWSVEAVLNIISLPNIVISLRVSPEEAKRRIAERSAHLLGLDPAGDFRATADYLRIAEQIETTLSWSMPVIRINTDTGPPTALARTVSNYIAEHLASRLR